MCKDRQVFEQKSLGVIRSSIPLPLFFFPSTSARPLPPKPAPHSPSCSLGIANLKSTYIFKVGFFFFFFGGLRRPAEL